MADFARISMGVLILVVIMIHRAAPEPADDIVKYATDCELCKLVAYEIETSFAESGSTSQVLVNAKGEKRSYLTSEVRFIESMEGLCDRLGSYRMHKEYTDIRRFQKTQSTTMKTLHGLVDKVKVDLGMPEQMWDEPSVEISRLQQECARFVEKYEEEIEHWYRDSVDKPLQTTMQRIKPSVQCYAWGKHGDSSHVARLYAAADEHFTIEPTQTYAELWIGTHPKGPSRISNTNQPLSEWLAANSDVVGTKLAAKLKQTSADGASALHLPLLFKVLSVNKALSIQSHPNKSQAEQLHSSDPTNYPDANHKPEMAIALTPFEMLCGFRPIEQIHQNIIETPELFELIGGDAFMALEAQAKLNVSQRSQSASRQALQRCFTELMSQPDVVVQRNVRTLVDRQALIANSRQQRGELAEPNYDANYVRAELLIRLNQHYPGDIGVFMPLVLNHFILQPAQSCFLAPNEPHAYLFGDCIECMACSDNTMRAGLSPKFKDVSTLCASLTYRMAAAEDNLFQPHEHDGDNSLLVYDPPVPEFVVHRIKVTSNGPYQLLALGSCSLLLVVEGAAELSDQSALSAGHVCLVPAASQANSLSITQTPFVAYRAFTNEDQVELL